MADYLQHSSKGTSWFKKQHEYNKKIRKRYYYGYEAALKKLWKLKKKVGDSEEYQKAKADYIAKKQSESQKRANSHIADLYEKAGNKTGATEYRRRANDIIPKRTKSIKLVDVTSDTLNKGKMILRKLLKGR